MSTGSSNGADAPFPPGEIPNAIAQIARLTEAVKSEFDLIAKRMTWPVVSESFTFSVFAAVLSTYRPDHHHAALLLYVLWVMPLTGMFLASAVYVTILAAHIALRSLKRQGDRMIEHLPRDLWIDLISTQSRIQWWGNVPTHIIPPVFIVIWLGALAMLLVGFLQSGLGRSGIDTARATFTR
jgi:hypothetical protein